MSREGKQELVQSYSALSEYLKKLEVENRKLAADLERKKGERLEREAVREKDGARSRDRLEAMAKHIDRADEVARKQREFLDEMQAFFDENEKRLARIGKRIAEVSSEPADMSEGALVGLRTDLVGILSELQEMRTRRETLMSRS